MKYGRIIEQSESDLGNKPPNIVEELTTKNFFEASISRPINHVSLLI